MSTRLVRLVLILASLALAGLSSVSAQAADLERNSAPTRLEGIWQTRPFVPLIKSAVGTSGVLKTLEGELPPFSADAENMLWHRMDMEQRGTPVANTQDTCRPRLPYAIFNLFLGPFSILQAEDKIVFFFETDADMPWTIYLNRGHASPLKPSYYGDSVGHWEGTTLVVDSIGFNGLPWLDGQGSPYSKRAHIVMRIDNLNNNELHLRVKIDDPVMYLHPWEYSYIADARRDAKIYEVHCLENVRPESNANIVYETLKPPPGIFQ